MPKIPDLTDPRYLDEVGWFLYHEKYRRDHFGGSYDTERLAHSRLLLQEVIDSLGRDLRWVESKTIVSLGCGCTGDLAAFPGAVKIAIDPLLYVYQQLGMLVDDEAGSPTVHLALGAEDLPLLDGCADLVICRNALDHMPDPRLALQEMWRILHNEGALFLSVDIGGARRPTSPPCSPWKASAISYGSTLMSYASPTTIPRIAGGASVAFESWRTRHLERLASSTRRRSSRP